MAESGAGVSPDAGKRASGAQRRYMRWARMHDENEDAVLEMRSIRQLAGATDRDREDRRSKQQQAFRRVLRDVARDEFVQERQETRQWPSPCSVVAIW